MPANGADSSLEIIRYADFDSLVAELKNVDAFVLGFHFVLLLIS